MLRRSHRTRCGSRHGGGAGAVGGQRKAGQPPQPVSDQPRDGPRRPEGGARAGARRRGLLPLPPRSPGPAERLRPRARLALGVLSDRVRPEGEGGRHAELAPPGGPRKLRRRGDRPGRSGHAQGGRLMGVTIQIPTPLRRFTGEKAEVEVSGATVDEALSHLTAQFPALRRHLYTDDGALRSFVNIFLNEEDVRRLQSGGTPVAAGDTLFLIPSIAGGAGGAPALLDRFGRSDR